MRRIRMRSGGFLYVMHSHEEAVAGQICMTEAEYAWMLKLSSAMHTKEEREALWIGVIEKKQADPSFSVFDSFPVEPTENDKQSVALRYSQEIISMLKGGGGKNCE